MKYYARIKTYAHDNQCGLYEWNGDKPYLTEGKLYPVTEILNKSLFVITVDDGFPHVCLRKGCAHLGGGDWEILSEDDIDALADDLWETVD